jgi:hypothetical protein
VFNNSEFLVVLKTSNMLLNEPCRRYGQCVGGADCDTDHYLVVAKVKERLAVSKRAAQKIDTERFNVKELNEGNVKEQYKVTTRNKFTGLEHSEGSGDINGEWDNI